MRIIRSLFLFLVFFASAAFAAESHLKIVPYVKHDADNNLNVLIEMTVKEGWHVFAPYEQTFGGPLTVKWQLPKDVTISEESFSKPIHFAQEMFSFDGYDKKIFYKAKLKASTYLSELPVKISWQACKDECIPEERNLVIQPFDNVNFDIKLAESEDYFALGAKKETSIDTASITTNWFVILSLAFLGGVILNLMPCIFPVLSIKLLSLMQMRAETRKQEALFYSMGVIVSMLVIASALFIIRNFNNAAIWGFQLQSPWFVGFMLILFIFLTLMMADVININSEALNKLAVLSFKNHKLNAFMTGLLAVLIATPCSAPFMGTAVGLALISSGEIFFPVFIALGIGYALPFALLAWYPKVMKKILPKPGKWMLVLKKILALPLALTAVWLAWVLSAQLGWWQAKSSPVWQEYSPQKLEEALQNKQPVFIDFTAKWCVTCLVNQKTTLQSKTMRQLVKEKNILLLKVDFTNQDKKVAKLLKKYGRAGVPLYVYYNGKSNKYTILPQLLTTGILEEYLN